MHESLFLRQDVLHAVSTILGDSKDFVDSPLRFSHASVSAAFDALPLPHSSDDVRVWYAAHFDAPGSDLTPCALPDFSPAPPFSLRSPSLQTWMAALHGEWPLLARCVSPSARLEPERHTLEWAPHPLVVPGGRFRESYLWDTHWIVQGLLRSGLLTTAGGVVRNLLHAIDAHGFAPNGGRSYYASRSQPPLASSIVWSYVRASGDVGLLAEALPRLERDYAWWMAHRAVALPGGALLNRYAAVAAAPRAEAWKEDAAAAVGLPPPAAAALWGEIAAAAESGFDFSSRWLRPPARGVGDTATSSVVPADLNAFLYIVERHLSEAAATLAARAGAEGAGGTGGAGGGAGGGGGARGAALAAAAAAYAAAAQRREAAMEALMYDAEAAQWRDIILLPAAAGAGRPPARATEPSITNWFPLWAGMGGGEGAAGAAGWGDSAHRPAYFAPVIDGGFRAPDAPRAAAIAAALAASPLLGAGGAMTTLRRDTGLQWDAPNAWPPVQDILVEGLLATGAPGAVALAGDLARRWLVSTGAAYRATGMMHEKMDGSLVGAWAHAPAPPTPSNSNSTRPLPKKRATNDNLTPNPNSTRTLTKRRAGRRRRVPAD
jgi:alpha,alpha-trehalase